MAAKISTPPRGLTPAFIEALQPREGRYDVPDRRAPGLKLRVFPSGAKSFRWTVNARGRVITLGEWASLPTPGRITLGEAHDWMEKLKAGHDADQLEAVEADLERWRKTPVSAEGHETSDPFKDVAEEFYRRRILPHRKRPEAVRDVLDRDLLPMLGKRPIKAISTRECAAVVERVVDRGAEVHAGKVLGTLKQAFRFAEARGYVDRNPAASLDPKDLGVVHNDSDRALTDEEIAAFWKALDAETSPPRTVTREDPRPGRRGKPQTYEQRRQGLAPVTRAALRILLLTGVRSGELLQAGWGELDLKAATWTIPVEHQKLNPAAAKRARAFVVPLAPTALELFKELQHLAGKSPWVMTGKPRQQDAAAEAEPQPFDGKALGHAMRGMFTSSPPMLALPGGPASPHDLRRTLRTGLGRLRVPIHVAEKCLNHSLGRLAKIYDVGDYLDERREALARWDAFVARLVNPGASNVVPLVEGSR